VGFAEFCRLIDHYVIDGVVDLIGHVPRLVADVLFRPMQNGLVQFYALAMGLGLTVFLIALARALLPAPLKESMPILLPLLLALPIVAAIAVARLGPRRGDAVRWISLGSALTGLVLALALAFNFVSIREAKQDSSAPTLGDATIPTFTPELRTRIDLLRLPGLNEPPDADNTVRQTAV